MAQQGIEMILMRRLASQLTMPVVMMSGHGTIETAVEATKIGAFDFLEKPIGLAKLLATISRALKNSKSREPRRISLSVLGTSAAVRETERAIEQMLAVRRPVLLLGESVPANLALGLVLVMAGVAAMTIPADRYGKWINRLRSR